MTKRQHSIPLRTLLAAAALLFAAAVAAGMIAAHAAGLPQPPTGEIGDGLPTTVPSSTPVPPPVPAPQPGGER